MIKNSLFQAICRTGIFMICAQAIVHFRPNGSYEKYLKLLMSIMVLIQLFVPIGSFFLKGGGMKTAELLEQFEKELSTGMQEAEKNARDADRLLEQMTLEEVRRRKEEAGENPNTGGEERAGGAAGEDEGAGDKAGEGRKEEREDIRIELEGIEPIKIGQEE